MTHRKTEVRIGLGRYEELLLWLIGAWFFTVPTLSTARAEQNTDSRKGDVQQMHFLAERSNCYVSCFGLPAVRNVSYFSLVLPAPSLSRSFFCWLRDFAFSGEIR